MSPPPGVVREDNGADYCNILGMACRLALDIGLNLDCTQLDIPKEEAQIRHMVLFACVVYDE